MRNCIIVLMIFLLSFLWTSCDNEEILPNTIIEGQVLEYETSEPVENATVTLYKRVSTGSLSAVDTEVETMQTDANGNYSFEYEGGGDYGVNARHDTYFEPAMIIYNGIAHKRRNKVDIVMDPYAWLKLHIKNVSPFDQNDLLRAYSSPIVGSSIQEHYGENIDFSVLQKRRGNRDIEIGWSVTKNDIFEVFRDTIYCQGGDTTYYELFY